MTISLRNTLLTLVAILAVAGCGSSNSKSADAGSGTGGTTGGSGLPNMCSSGSGATDTCTTAERTTYSNCVLAACDSTYKTCLGAGYRSGTYGGTCGTSFTCTSACGCTDTACLVACGLPSAECLTCLSQLGTCSDTCTRPACYTTSAGTGGITGGAGTGGITGGAGTGGITGGATGGATGSGTACADLVACCNASAIPQLKTTCSMAVPTSADDATCAMILANVKPTFCP